MINIVQLNTGFRTIQTMISVMLIIPIYPQSLLSSEEIYTHKKEHLISQMLSLFNNGFRSIDLT